MSTTVHSLIIMPGKSTNIYCKDGLSALDFYHVEQLFNFGEIKFVDCGAENEFVAFADASDSMTRKWRDVIYKKRSLPKRIIDDYETAKNIND